MSDRVRLEPHNGTLRVESGATLIAETTRAQIVHEQGLPARYYVPRQDVRAEIVDGQGAGVCPWKGQWRHVGVKLGDKTVPNAGWTYFETTPSCEPVRDFIAFYPEKVTIST